MYSWPVLRLVSWFFFFIVLSCSTLKSTPSQIGLLPLTGFRYLPENMITDTIYKVYQREEVFSNQFTALEGAKHPAFDGQWVVAVLLPAAATSSLRFEKAEVVGNTVNVYAQTCTTANCNSDQAVLATIPRVSNARRIQFFINGQSKNAVEL